MPALPSLRHQGAAVRRFSMTASEWLLKCTPGMATLWKSTLTNEETRSGAEMIQHIGFRLLRISFLEPKRNKRSA